MTEALLWQRRLPPSPHAVLWEEGFYAKGDSQHKDTQLASYYDRIILFVEFHTARITGLIDVARFRTNSSHDNSLSVLIHLSQFVFLKPV